jgi:hypothetical protein
MTPVEAYIRAAAQARGIDPDVAVRAARSEGGLNDPFRHGEGPAPKSQAPGLGSKEHSFGPFQLYISGTGAGLGDTALAKGIDPRKDWQGGVDLALDTVAQEGWKQWYGPKKAGIGRWDGVKQGVSRPLGTTINSAPISVASGSTGPLPPLPSRTVADAPIANVAAAPTQTPIQQMQGGDVKGGILAGLEMLNNPTAAGKSSPLETMSSLIGQNQQQAAEEMQIQPSGALAAAEGADAQRMAAAQGLMAQILASKKKIPGLSLMG